MPNNTNLDNALYTLAALLSRERSLQDQVSYTAYSFEDLVQALVAKPTTVFQYSMHGPGIQFLSSDLFCQPAYLLMEHLLFYSDEQLPIELKLELWLLDSGRIALVHVVVIYDHNPSDCPTQGICSEYRELVGFVEAVEDIPFNPLELFHQLQCTCEDQARRQAIGNIG